MTSSTCVLALAAGDGAVPPPWLAAMIQSPAPGVRISEVAEGAYLFASGEKAPEVRSFGDHLLIGEVFAAGRAEAFELARLSGLDGAAAARRLVDEAWGAYVHVHRIAGRVSVLRDPSGVLEALVWRRDGVTLVAGGLPDWLDAAMPQGLALDWIRIAAFVASSTVQTGHLALKGIDALAPGEVWQDGRTRQLWRPADFAPRRRAPPLGDPGELVEVVDRSVAGFAPGRVLIEVSGGLDSAIVAGSLAVAGCDIACAINYRGRDPQSDERVFAREVAAGLGVPLVEAEKVERPLDIEALTFLSNGPRPARNAFDHEHDRDVAERCRAAGVDVIMTGQGGDNILFQTPTPLICADALFGGLPLAAALDQAHWQRRSIYGLVGAAARARLTPEGRPRPAAHLTAGAAAAAAEAPFHPWLMGLEGIRPAKRMQIASLADALTVQGLSRRGSAARLRHPLLAQPVVEFCLGLEPLDLTRDGRDRGLARDAFAHRLPASIASRTTKGRLSSHYGRIFARSMGDIRPLLAEGRLVGEGLVDAARLDEMLTTERLLWRGGYGVLINLVMLELWVRSWATRIAGLGASGLASPGSLRR